MMGTRVAITVFYMWFSVGYFVLGVGCDDHLVSKQSDMNINSSEITAGETAAGEINMGENLGGEATAGEMTAGDAQNLDRDADLDAVPFDQSFFEDAYLPLDATVPPPGCDLVEAQALPTPDLDQKRFALSMFHFNLEYVIGGLYYDDDQGDRHYLLNNDLLTMGWDHERLEDWIITETFNPILELYEVHPDWGFTIELQGYMLKVLGERHPDVLERLRQLAQRGQAEVVSFHYAAQLFLAYPKEDLVRSIRRTRTIFTEHCVPLSGVVFNQEGQAGPGRQRLLLEEGYQIGVYPKNLWRYVRGESERWPYYQHEGGDLVVGPAGYDPASGIDVAWTFFDDGELRAVREGVNPYSAPLGGRDQGRLDEYEAEIQELVDQGYRVTTITDYVNHLKAQDVPQPEAPPLVDGTWQPPSTDSIHRWLGGRSQFFVGDEEDIKVRSGNAVARADVAAVQVLYEEATRQGVMLEAEWPARMHRLWEQVWHSQVSDFTGVNPWRGEVVYGLRTNRWLYNETRHLRERLLESLGWDMVKIDLKERTALALSEPPPSPAEPPGIDDPPLDVVIETPGRMLDVSWSRLAEDHYRLEIHISAQVELTDSEGLDIDGGQITVNFPRTEDILEYSPGLLETELYRHDLSDFDMLLNHIYVPLSNGLIGLGDGWYVIKEVRLNHVAGRVTPSPTVDFIDRSIPPSSPALWRFHVLRADPDVVLETANRLNIYPILTYQ